MIIIQVSSKAAQYDKNYHYQHAQCMSHIMTHELLLVALWWTLVDTIIFYFSKLNIFVKVFISSEGSFRCKFNGNLCHHHILINTIAYCTGS